MVNGPRISSSGPKSILATGPGAAFGVRELPDLLTRLNVMPQDAEQGLARGGQCCFNLASLLPC
jgi:hypothetical protein